MRPLPLRLPPTLTALLAGAALALTTLPSATAPAATAAPSVRAADPSDDPGRMVLVLDSSGSMKNPAEGGVSRIEAAKRALRQVVEQAPDDAEIGMRVFGATVEFRDQPGACTDTQNVVPVGPVDRKALTAATEDYRPYGETPIGNALKGAAQDLGPARDGERRTIVLLSDGEATCAPDPCKVAADLGRQGIDLAINVVGLNVSGKARRALRCIARAGHGQYYDASSADELANSLIKVSVRELRRFRLDGTRVEGGQSSEQALPLEPGTYVDTSVSEDVPRYYLVDVPEGGGLTASVLTRPPREEENWHAVTRIRLLTPDGKECANSMDQSFQVLGLNQITSTGVALNQFSNPVVYDEECLAAEQLLVAVITKGAGIDYRLALTGYPRIANADELPAPIEPRDQAWLDKVAIPAQGPREPVVGGVSFDDAAEIAPGTTYADTLRPSEQLVYKVKTGYGQAVRISARLGTDPQAAALLGVQGPNVVLNSFSALGQRQDRLFDPDKGVDGSGFYNGEQPLVLTSGVPPIRVRNIELFNPNTRAVTHDGYQYFSLGMGERPSAEDNEFAAPVALRVELVGEVDGEPEYDGEVAGAGAEEPVAAAEEDPAPAAAAQQSDGSTWPWVAGGVGAACLLALVFWLGRRSRT